MGKKILPWLPTVLVIIVIFYLTFQSPAETTRLSRTVQKWLASFYAPETVPKWIKSGHTLRSIAHIPEYFILSICLLLGFHFSAKRPVFFSSLAVSMIGIADELIKTMLPKRHFEIGDLGLDLVGLIIAVSLYQILVKFYQRKAKTNV